jgi:hypothetical protein
MKVVLISGLLVAGVAAGVWAYTAGSEPEKTSTLPAELSAEAIKAMAEKDPGKVFEAMGRDDLTEEQRRELMRNSREAMESMIDERVNEYYAAAESERQAILDRHIDEFQERRKEWDARRKEWQERREKEDAESKDEEKKEDGEGERRGWRGRFASMSRQDHKERVESRDPDKTAQRMAYFAAAMARAQARGIGMGGPGMRGPGGPGGRGPGGGGRGEGAPGRGGRGGDGGGGRGGG